jgi:sulfate permease, SulP family
VSGQIFFSSSEKFFQFFDFNEHIQKVEIELSNAHIWDMTSVNMLNAVVEKFEAHGVVVEVLGLNEASSTLIDRISS